MDEILTFLLMVTGSLSRQSLTLSPGVLNSLPRSEMYFAIHNYLPSPIVTYINQHIIIKLRPNSMNPIILKLWYINSIMDGVSI